MADAQETADQSAIVEALLAAPPAEQQRLLAWSRGLGVIRQGDKSAREKTAAMIALSRELKVRWPLLKLFGRALGRVLWGRRSWKARLAVGALLAVFVGSPSGGAGLVRLGAGVSLPLWAIAGLGGLAIGAATDALVRRIGKPRSGQKT